MRIVKKPEDRRREIVSVSKQLFLEKDYENTSIQEVIERLNIAKGTVYHYFKSKTELLDAVVQDCVDEYLVEVKKTWRGGTGSAIEKMHTLIAASKASEQLVLSIEALHKPGNIGMHTRLLAMTVLKLAPLYAEVIEQGCQEGIFQTDHPLECAEFLLASIQFLIDPGFYPWNSQDLVRRIAAIPSLIESQLRAPKGSFNFLFTSGLEACH